MPSEHYDCGIIVDDSQAASETFLHLAVTLVLGNFEGIEKGGNALLALTLEHCSFSYLIMLVSFRVGDVCHHSHHLGPVLCRRQLCDAEAPLVT